MLDPHSRRDAPNSVHYSDLCSHVVFVLWVCPTALVHLVLSCSQWSCATAKKWTSTNLT